MYIPSEAFRVSLLLFSAFSATVTIRAVTGGPPVLPSTTLLSPATLVTYGGEG